MTFCSVDCKLDVMLTCGNNIGKLTNNYNVQRESGSDLLLHTICTINE